MTQGPVLAIRADRAPGVGRGAVRGFRGSRRIEEDCTAGSGVSDDENGMVGQNAAKSWVD